MRTLLLAASICLEAGAAQAAEVFSQPLLIARQSGAGWSIEGRDKQAIGPVVRLERGQRIIAIDGRGIRQFQGPGEVHLSARDKQESLFDLAFKTVATPTSTRQREVVRAAAEPVSPPVDASPQPIVPRDRPQP